MDKYHYHDYYEYREIENIQNLFKLSIDKDHYKPILVNSGHNNNYIQYKSKGNKILTLRISCFNRTIFKKVNKLL